MEITNFLTWFVCIGLMASVGISAMIYAYRGQGTISVLFTQPILISSQTEATVMLKQGCEAFQVGNYQQAINEFTETIQSNSNRTYAVPLYVVPKIIIFKILPLYIVPLRKSCLIWLLLIIIEVWLLLIYVKMMKV
jgi:hypothetical protein